MGASAKLENIGNTHSPLTSLIVKSIRERIMSGAMAQGERLVEAQLSLELGVSRMPVREALRLLAAEGVVTIEPRRGATVTVYSYAQAQELVEVRATLEALNAKLAAKRHDPAQIAKLQRILDAGSAIGAESDMVLVQQENANFHDALAEVAANSVLSDMVRSLRDRTAVIFAPHAAKRAKQNWEEHAAILQAVIAGDAELAALLSARHVHSAMLAVSLPSDSGPGHGDEVNTLTVGVAN
jgi:DNA-binding GntR family transcriptional regulator